MKLVHPDLQFQIIFHDGRIPVVVVESPVRLRLMQRELLSQQQGDEGNWVLLGEEQEFAINKSVELVVNPLQLEENQKRIMNAFLQSLGKTATNETYWKKGQELNDKIQAFFGKLEMEYPFEYHINTEIDFPALAKAMGIRINSEFESDLERLLQYCILSENMIQTKVFVFFHLHAYFNDKEMTQFYQEVLYRKWNVLLVESTVKKPISDEKYYIIDEDNVNGR